MQSFFFFFLIYGKLEVQDKKKLNAIKWQIRSKRKVKIDGCQKHNTRRKDAQKRIKRYAGKKTS